MSSRCHYMEITWRSTESCEFYTERKNKERVNNHVCELDPICNNLAE